MSLSMSVCRQHSSRAAAAPPLGDLPRQMKPKHNSNPTLAFFTDFTLHSEPIAMDGEGRITPSSVHSALTLLQLLSCC